MDSDKQNASTNQKATLKTHLGWQKFKIIFTRLHYLFCTEKVIGRTKRTQAIAHKMSLSTHHKTSSDANMSKEFFQRKRTTKWQKGERLDKMREGGTSSHFRLAVFLLCTRSQLHWIPLYLEYFVVVDIMTVKRVRLFKQSISTVACELGLPERTLRRSLLTHMRYACNYLA